MQMQQYHSRHQMAGRFKCCGFRMTKPREAILDVLGKTRDHLSAEDIYIAIHKFYPNIGLTTVYRNLEVLCGLGMVVKFDFGDGKAKYELTDMYSSKGHHHHLICKKCFKVVDYSDFVKDEVELLDRIQKGLARKYQFDVGEHMIQFRGTCKACQKS